MKTKHVVVTDMSVGQVVDALLNGEKFYRNRNEVSISTVSTGITITCGVALMEKSPV